MAITTKPHVSQVEQKHSRCRKVQTEWGVEMWGISKGGAAEDQDPEEAAAGAAVNPGTDCNESQTSHQESSLTPREEMTLLHKCPGGRVERTSNC